MGKINYGRVIIGGLLAGVVITIGESILYASPVSDEWMAFMAEHGFLTEGVWMTVMYILWNFIIGFSLVLLYALIRPRCGAGPKTAVCAGLFVWFLVWFLCFGSMGVTMGMPGILLSLIWGLVEVLLAALAGGWAYKEESA